MSIQQVLARHTDSLLAVPGVVGVGEGAVGGAPSVQVMVTRLTDSLRARLPAELEGYPIQVVETGVIEAQPDSG